MYHEGRKAAAMIGSGFFVDYRNQTGVGFFSCQ